MAAGQTAAGRVRPRPSAKAPSGFRYQALYMIKDKEVTAGTYDTFDEARDAWVRKAAEARQRVHLDPLKMRTPFAEFAEIWVARHIANRANTSKSKQDTLRAWLVPTFGSRRMEELMNRELLQDWRADMEEAELATSTQKTYAGHLSAILGDAVAWGYLDANPLIGLFRFGAGPRIGKAFTRPQLTALNEQMPGPISKLFVDTTIQSGARFGEITELRVPDLAYVLDDEDLDEDEEGGNDDEDMILLHIQRNVADVSTGKTGRFKIEPTPKNGVDRKIPMGVDISRRLIKHVRDNGLTGNDLIFPLSLFAAELADSDRADLDKIIPFPSTLGMTEPNAKGRVYAHGTCTAYQLGPCRCEWCRAAYREYRAQRRAEGFDRKTPKPGQKRAQNMTGHLPRDTFRNQFWLPAIKAAGLPAFRFHDLRHTCATLLARAGLDVLELKARMGHKDIKTTMRYIEENRQVRTKAARMMGDIMNAPVSRRSRRRPIAATITTAG